MGSLAKSTTIEEILRGIVIPSPLRSLLIYKWKCRTPDLSSMASLISKDVGLSGAVIKTVNSRLHRGSREIDSIHQGVMMLDMKTIMDIINMLCLRNTFACKRYN